MCLAEVRSSQRCVVGASLSYDHLPISLQDPTAHAIDTLYRAVCSDNADALLAIDEKCSERDSLSKPINCSLDTMSTSSSSSLDCIVHTLLPLALCNDDAMKKKSAAAQRILRKALEKQSNIVRDKWLLLVL